MSWRSATCLTLILAAAPLALAAPTAAHRYRRPRSPLQQDSELANRHADQREASVGMRGRIEGLLLPGPELVARRPELNAALILRVVGAWPHGTQTRYDLEYYGLEPGSYDLAEWLVAPDGSTPEALPEIHVEVTPVLPPGQVLPREIEVQQPSRVGGYRRLMILAGVLWVAGLLLMIAKARSKHVEERGEPQAAPPTLAQRLRPHVQAAMRGELSEAGKAELERLLVAHWRERLDLRDEKAARAITKLREHDEAGRLLRQLEVWLHSAPDSQARTEGLDLSALLRPYENIPVEEHAPQQAGGGRA